MAARSLSKATLILNSLISRRGYATRGVVPSLARSGGVVMNRRAEDVIGSAAAAHEKSAWGPDPKTGYYRPENGREEIDVAKLRAALLRHGD